MKTNVLNGKERYDAMVIPMTLDSIKPVLELGHMVGGAWCETFDGSNQCGLEEAISYEDGIFGRSVEVYEIKSSKKANAINLEMVASVQIDDDKEFEAFIQWFADRHDICGWLWGYDIDEVSAIPLKDYMKKNDEIIKAIKSV